MAWPEALWQADTTARARLEEIGMDRPKPTLWRLCSATGELSWVPQYDETAELAQVTRALGGVVLPGPPSRGGWDPQAYLTLVEWRAAAERTR